MYRGNKFCSWCSSEINCGPPCSGSVSVETSSVPPVKLKKYRLVLEYLLQCDTAHYSSSSSENVEQQRRHSLLEKLLQFAEMSSGEGGDDDGEAYFQVCNSCETIVEEILKLHCQLEVIQMKLVDKVGFLAETVIANSMYGGNENAKSRMREIETMLHQKEGNGVEQGSGDNTATTLAGVNVERLKTFMSTLLEFQTVIFESGAKIRSLPCVYLKRCMPISSFAREVNDNLKTKSAASDGSISKAQKDAKLVENGEWEVESSSISRSRKREVPQKKSSEPPHPSQKKRANTTRLQEAKTKKPPAKVIVKSKCKENCRKDLIEKPVPILPEDIVKEEPLDDRPYDDFPFSPGVPENPHSADFVESEAGSELQAATPRIPKLEVTDLSTVEGIGKRARTKPKLFIPENYLESVPRVLKGGTSRMKKGRLYNKPKGVEVPKSLLHLTRVTKPKGKRSTPRQLKMKQATKLRQKQKLQNPCLLCSFNDAKDSNALIQHFREHEWECTEKNLVCKEPQCGERNFGDKQYFDYHMKLHKKINYQKPCSICGERLSGPSLHPHMLANHPGSPVYPCRYCYHCSSTIKDFVFHTKYHRKPSKGFNCPICGPSWNTPSIWRMRKHLYDAHGFEELLLKCEFENCVETFLTNTQLTNHYNVHLRKFICKECKEVFANAHSLEGHIRNVHKKLKMVMCEIGECLENFKDKYQLEAHQVKCHNFPTFKCDICTDKEYSSSDGLNHHKRKIHMERPHLLCGTCGKSCRDQSTLKRHLFTHGEKNFACEQCPFTCKAPAKLQAHKKNMHGTTPKRHACPYCDKRDNCRRAIADHIRTHTGERPYVCHLCSAAFAKKQAMTNHIRKVHKEADQSSL